MLKADWLILLFEKLKKSKSCFFVYGLICFISGIAAASFFLLGRAAFFYYYVILVVLAVCLFAVWKNQLARVIVFGGIFLILGAARFAVSEPPSSPAALRFYNNRAAELRGYAAAEPGFNEKQAITVAVQKIRLFGGGDEKSVSGKFVFYAPFYPQYHYGDKLTVRCFLAAPQSKNDATYPSRLARQGVWSVCLDPQVISATVGGGNNLKFLFVRLSAILTAQINKILNEPQASFLNGLLFGSRVSIPADLNTAFNRTGTTHIIAVSGFNITIVAGFLLAILRGASIPRKKAFWLAVLGIIFYVLLTGASASVARAGIMGIVVLLAKQTGRLSQAGRIIILAAFLMLLANPRLLFFDAGFELSFAATLGLVYISPLLEKYFARVPKFLGARDAIVTTVSAIVATAPLILYLFGRFSVVAIVANVLILPLIPLTMYWGFLTLVLSALFFPLGQFAGYLVWLPLTYIIKIVEWLASFSWASLEGPKFPWWIVVIVYIIMVRIVYEANLNQSKSKTSNF